MFYTMNIIIDGTESVKQTSWFWPAPLVVRVISPRHVIEQRLLTNKPQETEFTSLYVASSYQPPQMVHMIPT